MPVTPLAGAPLVDLTPYNYAKQDYRLCAVSCFAEVVGQSTVAYSSYDSPRSLTLMYNSDRVNPRPIVLVNVGPDLTYAQTPAEYRLQVKVKWDGVNPTLVTFLNGDQTLRFTYPSSAPVRLGGQFDASTHATNVYPMDILVSAYYASTQTLITTDITTQLVLENETSSPVAAGWMVGGIQRLYKQADGSALITEGDGSVVYFAYVNGVWVSPGGEFSKLIASNLGGPNGWARIYPDSSKSLYDSTGRMVQLRDRFSNSTVITYDGSGRVWKVTDPASLTITLAYNANGLATIQDPGSPVRTTNITVDGSHHLTAISDPDNISTTFVFDANTLLTKSFDRRGDSTLFTYNSVSRKLTNITYPKVPIFGSGTIAPTASHSPWQTVGIPTTSTASSPAPAALSDTIHALINDPRGFITLYQVDRFGAISKVDDAAGRATRFVLDTNAHVIRDSSPSGHVIRSTWSGPNLTQLWDSTTGNTTNFAYENIWNQMIQISGDADSVWNYWAGGRLDSTVAGTRANGSAKRLTKFTYDTRGRLVTATDPLAHSDTVYYDGTVWKNTDSIRAGGRHEVYTYDSYGRVASAKNPRGDVTSLKYDLLNRRDTVIGPLFDTTVFTYDGLFLTQVRDAIHQTYQFGNNALGWETSLTDPRGKQQLYQYDQNGNLRQWTNRRGQVISWDPYDALNRATVRTADGKKTKLAYDLSERFVVDSNVDAIDTIRLNVAGQIQSQISVRSGTRYELASHVNVRGLRDSLRSVSPWVAAIAYHYGTSMVLDTLVDIGGGRTSLTYDQHLLNTGLVLPNGLSVSRQYPATHQTAQVTYNNGTVTSAIGSAYDYDTVGLVTDRHNMASDNSIANTGRDYTHDGLGRLTRYGDYTVNVSQHCVYSQYYGWDCGDVQAYKIYSIQEYYTYDKVGNRTDLNAITTTGNRLIRFNGDSLVYDDDGNLIRRVGGGQDTQRLYWNSVGQLVAVWTSGQDSVSFGYDGLGRRVAKRKVTGTTRIVYDEDELFAEVDSATGNRLAEYTYYPWVDNPHSVRIGGPTGSTYYYAQDFPGNVTGLTNSSGAIVNQYKYKPFGVDNGSSETVANSVKFAGRQFDTETGLYYMRERYYDPKLGRFLSEDPVGLAAGVNPYVYAGNDPVNFEDPSGEQCQRTVTTRQVDPTTNSLGMGMGDPAEVTGVVVRTVSSCDGDGGETLCHYTDTYQVDLETGEWTYLGTTQDYCWSSTGTGGNGGGGGGGDKSASGKRDKPNPLKKLLHLAKVMTCAGLSYMGNMTLSTGGNINLYNVIPPLPLFYGGGGGVYLNRTGFGRYLKGDIGLGEDLDVGFETTLTFGKFGGWTGNLSVSAAEISGGFAVSKESFSITGGVGLNPLPEGHAAAEFITPKPWISCNQ